MPDQGLIKAKSKLYVDPLGAGSKTEPQREAKKTNSQTRAMLPSHLRGAQHLDSVRHDGRPTIDLGTSGYHHNGGVQREARSDTPFSGTKNLNTQGSGSQDTGSSSAKTDIYEGDLLHHLLSQRPPGLERLHLHPQYSPQCASIIRFRATRRTDCRQ